MDNERDDVEMSSTAEYTLSQACRFKAERDKARQRLQGFEEWTENLEDSYRAAWEQLVEETAKARRLGKLVWRLQNRLARAHRREWNLRKGMRMWREKAIGGPVRTMSAYDLLPEADLETLRWVREQGGLGVVRTHAELFQQLKGERDELRELARDYEKRLMPEGMEWLVEAWPRFEDGEPVKFGDAFRDHQGSTRSVLNVKMWQEGGFEIGTGQGSYDWYECGERVKRPAKVLDADGVEIELGDDLYSVEGSLKFHVSHVDRANGKIATDAMFALDKWADPKMYTHRAAVLAADGNPLRVGETVWCTNGNGPFEVTSVVYADKWRVVCDSEEIGHLNVFPESITHRAPVLAADGLPLREGEKPYRVNNGKQVEIRRIDPSNGESCVFVGVDGRSYGYWLRPGQLTHERPDSWVRLEEDAEKFACEYFGRGGKKDTCTGCRSREIDPCTAKDCEFNKTIDLVRRAKALAECDR